ncbi:malonyl-CoA decarboxylase [Aestuariivirga sp.]|uniref:malonyl-CoA decarboxylase n=1 Tax=Aestuariivirga sp. TaxID=2650926 RepID=UPI003919A05C
MPERQRDVLSELLQAVAERSRKLLRLPFGGEQELSAEALAEALLSTRGEASGVALARALLQRWNAMGEEERRAWFHHLARELGPERDELESAVAAWVAEPSPAHAGRLHRAAEPRRQELFRRMNLAPGGTATLVRMRAALLAELAGAPELAPVDADFERLFASWFNRGFLVMKRIDWSSPADILEKIIRYEAVHEIHGWADLKGRLQPADRRCFAFFHPQIPEEPLVFVEVALTRGMPAKIAPLIAADRQPIAEEEADTAVFYSISNTQDGLRGVSFGNFLIKQVVEELLREVPGLRHFVTLSPVPGFAAWLERQRGEDGERRLPPELFAALAEPGWHERPEQRDAVQPLLERAAAIYLLEAKARNGKPADPVARFHLNNGAALERIDFCGDVSEKGLRQSHGVMVNYLYDPAAIERNHEAYAHSGDVTASAQVRRMLALEEPGSLSRGLQALLPPRGSKAGAKKGAAR